MYILRADFLLPCTVSKVGKFTEDELSIHRKEAVLIRHTIPVLTRRD
jgi:hypothetical protein